MADMVRAVVQTGPRQMEIREFPRPVIGPDDGALLRVEACGICGSDVEQYKGAMGTRGLPMIPGHEPLGVIEEIAPSTAARWGVNVGDRVAVEILIPCRSCDLCLAGRYMQCKNRAGSHGGYNPPERGLGLWGGYAEYMHLHPNSIVHPMRADLPAEIAVMFNPLGAGVRWALQYGGVHLGSSVLVLGAGQRGLAAILASKYVGAGLIIATGLGRDAKKLALAREFGADYTINVDEEDTVERVRELTGGDGADVVLDLTPMAQQPVRDAIDAVRWGGTIVLGRAEGPQGDPDHHRPADQQGAHRQGRVLRGRRRLHRRHQADRVGQVPAGEDADAQVRPGRRRARHQAPRGRGPRRGRHPRRGHAGLVSLTGKGAFSVHAYR